METLQSTIFIEFDVNTKKITFLRKDNIIDYDSNATSIYVRVKYKDLSGNTTYLTPSELESYEFFLYTIKPTTNDVNEITGEVTDELKENTYGGVVKFEIPRKCTNRLGIVKCEIHINQWDKMIASSTFVLDVKQSLVTAFNDELLGDEDFPVLKQLILEIQKVRNIDDNNISKITTYSSDKIETIKRDIENKKANKNDVRMKNINITLNDCDNEMLSAIKGGEDTNFEILSIPRDGSVTEEKTTFARRSKNLFNINTIIENKKMDSAGVITDDNMWVISDYIKVDVEKYYKPSKPAVKVLYDSNLNYLTGHGNSNDAFKTTSGTAYVRLCIERNSLKNFQFEQNSETTSYEDYGIIIDDLVTKSDASTQELNIPGHTYKRINMHDEIINIFDIASRVTDRLGVLSKSGKYVYKDNKYAYKLEHFSGSSSEFRISLNSLPLEGIQEFDVAVYIEDATKVTNIELQLLKDSGSWVRSSSNLRNGWNYIRLSCSDGDISTWNVVNTVRVIAYCNNITALYFGGIYAIKPNKAKIIMVDDHGYSGFKNIAYPKLKELGVPVTWAINPGRLGMPISNATSILSQDEIDELALDPYSEFSFHAWNASEKATNDMTPDELKTETHKCIHYLKKQGLLPKYFWRAAFVQNKAPNHAATQEMLEAYATPNEKVGFILYPFIDCYNINRTQIHSRSNEWFDNFFETLKKTHCVAVIYTHDISDNGGIHMTNNELNYFLTKLENAINEGWLEGVTYSQLRTRYEKDFGQKGWLDFYDEL